MADPAPDTDAVLRRAVQLQAERDEAHTEALVRKQTAAELGIAPATLRQAAADIYQQGVQAETAARERRRRTRLYTWITTVVTVVGLAGAWLAMQPPPPPFVDTFDGTQAQWALATNPNSRAVVQFAAEPMHGAVAALQVQAFGAETDGKYFVNLDRAGILDLSEHHTVKFCSRGQGLATVRLYLESGDLRWRSPPVALGDPWASHVLPIASFETQRRAAGGWQTVAFERPTKVARLSFKFGHFINRADATGSVQLDDVRIE